jgi:hypothetical protein
MDLIRMRWAPRSLRSVLICAADDLELRPIVEGFSGLEICIERAPEMQSFGLQRLLGAAALVAGWLGGLLVAPAQLAARLRIDGVLIPSAGQVGDGRLAGVIAGQHVTSVHSHAARGKAPSVGMWISGEMIIAQALLARDGGRSSDVGYRRQRTTMPWKKPSAGMPSLRSCSREQPGSDALRTASTRDRRLRPGSAAVVPSSALPSFSGYDLRQMS